MRLSMEAIITACKGTLLCGNPDDAIITAIGIDTRTLTPAQGKEGPLFVPIRGERFDGHDYIQQAAASGAVCALTEKNISPPSPAIPLIQVPSTRQALLDLAAYYRRIHDIKVVAVTGSAGKTTTKEMMASILSQRYKTKKTLGNFNNDIGLPLSIFQLEADDKVLVLEMGMNHANEITTLSKVGAPDIAVITHIGDAHIENFANREGILHAKLEIVDGLHPQGIIIFNGDDPLLTGPIADIKVKSFRQRYPGAANIIHTQPRGMTETRCHFRIDGQDIHLTVPLPGNHMVMNALLAASVGIEMGLTPSEIAQGFDALEVPGGRLSILHGQGMTIINDAYNANPASMREAIKVLLLEETKSRRVCILGDMNELGHVSEARHRELGVYAASSGIDLLVAIGPMARHIHKGYQSASEGAFSALYFPDIAAFMQQWRNLLFPGDIILVKASRGMAFENIVEGLIS
ncbi:MAG: UDP-N-acetylmuramoyl-tripeptide--D-alanyl-D-alanine ligase [Defluviitaleaceae bacterium]|nr:UDP-N-acetylmuramoyl-tripeptide--D-alanyl-D-alanine ligase [Defluviitaleaceae bacterium]MCL2239967.1 UDP-N-acetylmuramoyl-tripeptide--D-alanyl-D-alanine ligase [Defluviitaleaceae bacterium]